jgi:hypothetical protein
MQKLLFLILFLAHFATAQTPIEERQYDKLASRKTEKPLLPPAQTDGVEQFQRGRLWGWRKMDTVLVEPVFSRIEPFYSKKMVAKKGKLYGLIDECGREILSFEYDNIEKFHFQNERVDLKNPPNWFWLRLSKNYKMGLMDSLAQVIVPLEFDKAIWSASDTVIIFMNRGQQVFVSPSCRKPYLETHFDSISNLALPIRGFFAPVLADGQMALASLKTGTIEFENAEYLQPAALAELLKTQPDLPKDIKWPFRAQHLDGRAVLIDMSGKIFELNY